MSEPTTQVVGRMGLLRNSHAENRGRILLGLSKTARESGLQTVLRHHGNDAKNCLKIVQPFCYSSGGLSPPYNRARKSGHTLPHFPCGPLPGVGFPRYSRTSKLHFDRPVLD